MLSIVGLREQFLITQVHFPLITFLNFNIPLPMNSIQQFHPNVTLQHCNY